MNIIIGCEASGVIRRSFRARGHDAWSCDLKPAEDNSAFHLQRDIRTVLDRGWNMGIFHPECTFMANSGVQWLRSRPGRLESMKEACNFFLELWNAPIAKLVMENPVMHGYAKRLIGMEQTQTVQPWWFGDEAFKATCLWLRGLPKLTATNKLTPPKLGTDEHKRWSKVHREPPGPNRKANRSRTLQGIADAMAEQWGNVLAESEAA